MSAVGKLAAIGTTFACLLVVTMTADGAFPGKTGRLVFASEDEKLFSVWPDGSRLRRLTDAREGDSRPSFSPDGERLAFVRGEFHSMSKVVIARRDGSDQRRIFTGAYDVAWAPDGASLAVVDLSWEIDLVGTGGHRFDRVLPPDLLVRSVSWSPNGRRLAFGVRQRKSPGALYIVQADGGGLRAIVREPQGTNLYWPEWSPDGRRIAFTEVENCAGETCSGPGFVSVVDADGSDKQRLTRGFGPAWSPDGTRLALDGDSGISILRLDDGTTSVVTSAHVGGIDWQPICTSRGGLGRDRLRGGAAGDVICGLAGNDVITGGGGSDRLFGEEGNDRFFARDRRFDIIGCGPGIDSVVADRIDRVGRDCERVRRL